MADSAVRGKAEPFRALPELPVPWYRTKTVPPDVPRYRPERYIVFNQDREEHDMIEQSPQRTALITGASRGLGLALARALADEGWTLIIDARGEGALESARAELSGRTRVSAIPGDVSEPGHRVALAEAAREAGGLDALVNNASILGPSPKPALEQLSNILAAENPNLRVYRADPGDMRTRMQQEAFPDEDISDRPLPEESVPGFLELITGDIPSGRYEDRALATSTPIRN